MLARLEAYPDGFPCSSCAAVIRTNAYPWSSSFQSISIGTVGFTFSLLPFLLPFFLHEFFRFFMERTYYKKAPTCAIHICDAVALQEALEEHREAQKYYFGGARPIFFL